MPDFHVAFEVLLHAVIYDMGPTAPKEGVLRIFSPEKIRRLQPGLNPPPRNLGTKGQHATSRPPKPLCRRSLCIHININILLCILHYCRTYSNNVRIMDHIRIVHGLTGGGGGTQVCHKTKTSNFGVHFIVLPQSKNSPPSRAVLQIGSSCTSASTLCPKAMSSGDLYLTIGKTGIMNG
jgi:hypothetical protein